MKRSISLMLLAAWLVAMSPAAAFAYIGLCCAKCGGNMPMNIPGGGVPATHEFRFKVQPVHMRMEGLRNGTTTIDPNSLLGMPNMGKFMAVPTSMDMSMLNLAAGYSLTDDLFIGAMAMYAHRRMDMRFNSMMQMTTGQSGFTMESDGFADTMLMTKYRLYADDPLIPCKQVSLFAALSLPSGSVDERNSTHPVTMRQAELQPYGMQLGSGTVDPSLGVLYQGSSSPWWWGVNGVYTGRWYDNKRNYRLGDAVSLDLYTMYQLRYDWLVQLQLNGNWQGRIRGGMDEVVSGASGHATKGDPLSAFTTPLYDPANYGGTNLFATLGVQWQPVPLQIIDLQVGLPLYRDINGPQLETDWRLMFTWYVEFPTSKSVRYMGGSKHPSKLGFESEGEEG